MATLRNWTWLAVFTAALFSFGVVAPSANARPPRKSRKKKEAPRPTTGQLQVFSVAKGANVEVDGRPLGTLPLSKPLVLGPGSHTVRVWKRGHLEFMETVEIFAGETAELDADLIAVAGMVKIFANVPGALVVIDGKLAGEIPFNKDIPAGKHTITVKALNHAPFEQNVDVIAGQWLELQVRLQASGTTEAATEDSVATKWWFWTVIGAVVIGGAATGLALGLQDSTAPAPPAPARVLNLR